MQGIAEIPDALPVALVVTRPAGGKRVAAAVGEGSATVSMVHRYLQTV